LDNRIIRAATQDPFAKDDGNACEAQVKLYGEVAKSGVGLIINGHTYVSPEGRATAAQIGFCNEEHYASQQTVLDAVHKNGGKLILQINHAGLNTYIPEVVGGVPFAPTGGMTAPNGLISHEINEEDMDRLCADYVAAAVRGQKMGFDGVQLHCAHSYLLSQFLDPNFNHRTDEYGGSAENRFRIVRKFIRALREALGKDYPLLVKINSNCAGEADAAYEEDLIYFCKQYEAEGLDAIELSGFDFVTVGRKNPHIFYLERAKKVRAAVNIPLILVGGIRTQADIDTVLDAGIDYVALCRPFICQPDLVAHLKSGEDSPCVSCSKCFSLWNREGRRCIKHEKV
ncbi:MAG: NADH:flavin oxidoreductase, partial [Evtepia sp.]